MNESRYADDIRRRISVLSNNVSSYAINRYSIINNSVAAYNYKSVRGESGLRQ